MARVGGVLGRPRLLSKHQVLAELCVRLGPDSKGLPIGWLPGFLAFLSFFPLERLSISRRELYTAYSLSLLQL